MSIRKHIIKLIIKNFQLKKWIKNQKNHFLDSEKKMSSGPIKTLPDWPTLYLKKHFKKSLTDENLVLKGFYRVVQIKKKSVVTLFLSRFHFSKVWIEDLKMVRVFLIFNIFDESKIEKVLNLWKYHSEWSMLRKCA